MAPVTQAHPGAEREPVPDERKESYPWLNSMERYVNRWLPEGFPDHIDANEVYASIARSKFSNSNHGAYRALKSELESLIDWMSARDTWSTDMPFIGSPSTMMSLCCLVPGQEGLPPTIQYLVDTSKLAYLLHPLGEVDVDPFWHGAMLEDDDWRAEHMLFGKPMTTRHMPDEDLNKYFKGVRAPQNSMYRLSKDRDTLKKAHGKKRPRDDETDDASEAVDLHTPSPNTDAISKKLQATLVDTLAANANAFKDAIEGIFRESLVHTGSNKAHESDNMDAFKNEMKSILDQMEIIINDRLDDLEGNVQARLDGVECAFGKLSKRVEKLEDMNSGKAIPPQELPVTPQSGPRVPRREIRDPHFEPITPSPTTANSSYFDAEFGTPGTPSPSQSVKKVSVEDRLSIVRVINDIPVGMWAKDDIPIIRRCRREFPHPQWPTIIFTMRSVFVRGGFLDSEGRALGDDGLFISAEDWDVVSGLKDL